MSEGYNRKYDGSVIAIDFDGTIVTHEFPLVGKPVPLAKEVIKMLIDNGHKCFLYTMRDEETLEDAKRYCIDNGIDLCGYNKSPDQFSDSPKQYATFYIDDAALGCPRVLNDHLSWRPYVDWLQMSKILKSRYLISEEQMIEIEKLYNDKYATEEE